MQKGRKAVKLAAVLIVSLVLSLAVPSSFSVFAADFEPGQFKFEGAISYLGGYYISPGQKVTQRVSMSFSTRNNDISGVLYGYFIFNFTLPTFDGCYLSITDMYVAVGSERHEVSYETVNGFDYSVLGRFRTDNAPGSPYVMLVMTVDVICTDRVVFTADDERTQTISHGMQSAYDITIAGTPVTETKYAGLFLKHKYLGQDNTDWFDGTTRSTTSFSGVKLSVPYRPIPNSTIKSLGDVYVRLDNTYLPRKMVNLSHYDGSVFTSNYDYDVDDDRTHELLEQLIREGGTNADTGTHNRLDSMLQQQQQQAQDQLKESEKQTDALTSFEGKGSMDSSKTELDSTMGSYDEAERNLFETAGSAIGAIDMATSLKPSAGVLSGIQYLSGFLVNIIAAMGEFSIIYTAGYVIVLILILFGLFKYTSSSSKEE